MRRIFTKPVPLWEHIADYALAAAIGVALAALLTCWWTS